MNRPNDEYYRDEYAIYRRNTSDRYRSNHHKRTVSPTSSRGERYSPYRTIQRSKSRSRSRYRSRSCDRHYSDERKRAKRRHRMHSSGSKAIPGSNDERKRSKTRLRSKLPKHRRSRKPTKSPSKSPSNSPNFDENALHALKEKILSALSSNRDTAEKPTAINSEKEWQDTWDIDVESSGSEDMDVTEYHKNYLNKLDSVKNEHIWPKCDLTASGLKEHSTTVDHFVDDEIIQKIISKPVQKTIPDASILQFDFDLVKQAVSTVKMLERKDTTYPMFALPNVQTSIQQDSAVKPQRLLPPTVKLPIPSTNFLPRSPFQTPTWSTPRPHHHNPYQMNHHVNSLNYNQQKFPVLHRRSPTYVARNSEPTTYGEYKRLQASKSSDVLIAMPKKTKANASAADFNSNKIKRNQECATISSRPSASAAAINNQFDDHVADDDSIDQPATLSQSDATINNHLENSSSDIKTATDPVENPSAEEQVITTLKESIGTSQFATLVDLIKKMTKGDTLQELITSTSNISEPTSSHCGVTIKNNQREWHSLTKIVSCKVCDKPHGNSLVSHYVNNHPDEDIPISRLAPEGADSLRSRKGILECKIIRQREDRGYQYEQFCYFCNIYKCLPKCSWITHMARHTGYYAYKCNQCSRMLAQKLAHKCTKNNDFTKITHPQFKKRKIKAYVCDLCNYVRFRKREIQNHLNKEHDDDSKKTFNKFNFLRFPSKNRKKWSKNASETKTESEYENNETSEDQIGNECEDGKSKPSEQQDDSDDELLTPMRCK